MYFLKWVTGWLKEKTSHRPIDYVVFSWNYLIFWQRKTWIIVPFSLAHMTKSFIYIPATGTPSKQPSGLTSRLNHSSFNHFILGESFNAGHLKWAPQFETQAMSSMTNFYTIGWHFRRWLGIFILRVESCWSLMLLRCTV